MTYETPHSKAVDLIVVGAGGSGMSAALVARRRGLKVLVVEKADKIGGTTGLSVGSIMATRTRQQIAAGIVDSPEEHAADILEICEKLGVETDREIVKLFTENAADSIEFLNGIGVNFLAPMPQPPHKKSRLHQVLPTSRAYVERLGKACRREGVEILVSHPAKRVVVEDGKVVGVEVEHHGRSKTFRSRAGVILASGDIGGNDDMMFEYVKTWEKGITPFNPVNTGDGHRMAADVGAYIVPRKDLVGEVAAHIRFVQPKGSIFHKIPANPLLTKAMQWSLKVFPDWFIRPIMMRFLTTTLGPDRIMYENGAILINKNGERFADELGLVSLKLPKQPEGKGWIIFDDAFAKKFEKWPYFIATAPGVAFAYVNDFRTTRPDLYSSAATAEQLARKLDVDLKGLQATIEASFGPDAASRGPFHSLGPLKTWLIVAQTGLAVNTRLEVLRKDGTPIPGLYAAGMTGTGKYMITGHGHGLGWAFTSGRLAAKNAADRFTNS